MNALEGWLAVLVGWLVISIPVGSAVGRILRRLDTSPGRVPERRAKAVV